MINHCVGLFLQTDGGVARKKRRGTEIKLRGSTRPDNLSVGEYNMKEIKYNSDDSLDTAASH